VSEQNKRPENSDPNQRPAPKKRVVQKKAAAPKKEEKTKNKKPWWIWVILLLIILLIALVAGYYSGYFVGKVVHEQTEQTTVAPSESSSETDSTNNNDNTSDEVVANNGEEESPDSSNTADGDIPVENVTELQPVMYKSSPRSDKIPVPSFIIAYSANADKIQANRNFSHLESLGFESGIYWIPDFFSAGKPLYKVYVGPFTTRSDAETRLIAVRKLQADAYIMKVE